VKDTALIGAGPVLAASNAWCWQLHATDKQGTEWHPGTLCPVHIAFDSTEAFSLLVIKQHCQCSAGLQVPHKS
jgi:hypothetical protein